MTYITRQLSVKISGKVQGVWYRASTRDQAVAFGLTGWVKNLPDGRVEAVFEGPEDMLKSMLDWCWKGPANARVDDIDQNWGDSDDSYKIFEVRY